MNKQNKIVLIIGILLVVFGWFKPDISGLIKPSSVNNSVNYVVDAPSEDALLEASKKIIEIVRKSDDSTRKSDCLRLSSLYADMALLIELDNTDMVIKDTTNIREANGLCGKMLKLDIKDKYPNLAESAENLVVTSIGKNDVQLTPELRSSAVKAFRALSWAFYEGSK
jgi:hypothetical protein